MNFLLIAINFIGILGILVIIRTWLGPGTWDRLLGLSMISAKVTTCIVLLAALMEHSFYLDIAIVFAMLGFVGNILLARFVQRRRDHADNPVR